MEVNVNEMATRLGVEPTVAEEIFSAGHAQGKATAMGSVHSNAAEMRLSPQMYEDAYRKGMNLSAYLETLDPSDSYRDGLDAFERQLKIAGIHVRSDPRQGMWADKVEKFWRSDKPGTEVLFPEYLRRMYNRARHDNAERFYASSSPVSDVIKPDYLAAEIRQKQIAPAIPLSAIVAVTTPIDTDVYKAFFLTDDEGSRQMVRVSEGAEFPTVKLTGGDHSVNLKKYGRRLKASYESIRRIRIDRFAIHLQLLAVQAEVDKFNTGIDILLNGDGNSGTTPTNSNLTTLDTGASADTLTLKGYLSWLQLWANPYLCTTVLARNAYALQLILLTTGSGNVHLYQMAGNFGVGGVSPINSGLTGIQLGWTSAVTDKYLLGFDNRVTLEMVTEIGTDLIETNRIIANQFEEIVMSEVVGFAIMDANALRTMNVNA